MTNNLKASVVIDLAGNLQQQAQKYVGSLQEFSRRGSLAMGTLRYSANMLDRGLDELGNRYVALATGGAVVLASKRIMDFRAELTDLLVKSGEGSERLDEIKKKIEEVADATDIRIEDNQLLLGLKEMSERGIDLDVGLQNLRNLGLTIRAAGIDGQRAGALIGSFYQQFDITDAKQINQMLDETVRISKEGRFRLEDMATYADQLSVAMKRTGRVNPAGLKEMIALVEMISKNTKSPRGAATSFDAMISEFTGEKSAILQRNGVKIWDHKDAKTGELVMRPLKDVLQDLFKATHGNPMTLTRFFDPAALKAINAFAEEWRANNGTLPTLERFMHVMGDGNQLLEDSSRNASTAKAAFSAMGNAFEKIADGELTPALNRITKYINELPAERVEEIVHQTKQWAIGIGSVVLAYKGLKTAAAVVDSIQTLRGKGSGGNPLLNIASKFAPVPVYVVNGPGGLTDALGGAGRVLRPSTWKLLRNAPVGAIGALGGEAMLTAGAYVGAAGLAGYGVGTLISKAIEGTEFSDALGRSIARALAAVGNGTAAEALAYDKSAKIQIELKGDAAKNARITRTDGGDLDVHARGAAMGTR